MEEKNQIKLFTIQDIYDYTDKQIPIDITKKYDPLHFWDDFGEGYYKSYTKQAQIQKYVAWVLDRLRVLAPETLLDVGCGFCRIEPFILDDRKVKEITAIDISQKQLDSAGKYLEDYTKKDKITTVKASGKNMPFEQNMFDCVVSIDCMSHMHLPSVRYVVKNMERVSKKYMIIIERFVYDGEHPQPHIWSHDYPRICYEYNYKVLESVFIMPGVIGMVLKK